MADTVNGLAFAIIAMFAVGGSIAMLTTRNVVHAAYWLLGVSVATAGVYLLLDAEYMALVQLLIYAGALAILLIFTIMITLRRREDAIRSRDLSIPGLALAAVLFGVITIAVLDWSPAPVAMPETAPDLVAFGLLMFSPTGWAVPFEIASLILTAALVAAVWWSKEGDD